MTAATGPKIDVTTGKVPVIILKTSFVAARGRAAIVEGRHLGYLEVIIYLLRGDTFIVIPAFLIRISI